MFDYAEIPSHPGADFDSASVTTHSRCGLCPKPKEEANEDRKSEGFFCFNGGKVYMSVCPCVFHCFILDQTLCIFPFNNNGTENFSPITADDGTRQCLKGDTLEDCNPCEGIADMRK